MSVICRHLPDLLSGSLANFVRLAEFFCRPYIGKYHASQAVLCQTYGLAHMKKLPGVPKFCLVSALDNNTAGVSKTG